MNWKLWLGAGMSALFLFLAVRKVDADEIGAAMKSAEYLYLVPAVLLGMLSIGFRALRWRYLLEPVQRIRFHSLFSATVIGLMANNLFPARLGEFVRAYAIARKEGIGKSASFATIVVERLFDGFTILSFLFIISLLYPFSFPDWVRRIAYFASGLFVLSLLFLIFLKVRGEKAFHLAHVITRPFPKKIGDALLRVLQSFVQGLQILQHGKNIVVAGFLSFMVWIPFGFIIYLLLKSFGIVLPVYVSFFMLSIVCLGVMIPSAPGYVGTIQFLCVAGLALFGIEKSQALSFSILFHASQFVPITAIGLLYFFMEGFSFRQIGSSSKIFRDSDRS